MSPIEPNSAHSEASDVESVAPEPVASEPIIEEAPEDDIVSGVIESQGEAPSDEIDPQGERANVNDLPPQDDFDILPVVGVGGSAGSIGALQRLFSDLPSDTGMGFVVVLHLSPDHESQLCAVIQRHTVMPVISVTEPMKLEANHVYVIPPGKHLTLHGDTLDLSPMENEFGKRVAVDLFFRTLAASQRGRAVAVVLSGLDSDGAVGIKRIKEQGGVTIAQDPDEAEHSGMPRAAIQTGMVDWVLPVGEMAPRLVKFIKNEGQLVLPPAQAPENGARPSEHWSGEDGSGDDTRPGGADEAALRDILGFLQARTGHDFSHYKRATILRRIARRLQVNTLANFPDYLAFLRTHPGESGALLQDLLISVTNFFRDPESFAALQSCIPQLFRDKKAGDQVRVWVAGCATGEEAYSLAMLLVEHADTLSWAPEIQIFATDIDDEATRCARAGRYPQAIAADVSPERLRRFFTLEQGYYRVRKDLRERVLFASHNLLRDSPFSRLDLVTCRNVLIYFNAPAQQKVFSLFHFALRPEGLLFLGGSESAEDTNGLFKPLDKKHRIYARKLTARLPVPLPLALPAPRPSADIPKFAAFTQAAFTQPAPAEAAPQSQERANPALNELHLRLLEQYAPPSVLVDADYEILHLSQHAGRMLRFAGGKVSTNLMDVVLPELRLELRSALFRAVKSGEGVDVVGLAAKVEDKSQLVDIRVRPLLDSEHPNAPINYLLVIFASRETEEQVHTVLASSEEDALTRRLELELLHLKDHLRATVEQYETTTEELKASNEELQAMNEELRSASEELETSREELQSTNEELTTLNQEMKSRVEEIGLVNSDLQNLMASTNIATIFLDRQLNIKRYTPPATELFNLVPTDEGRPLALFRFRLQYDDLTGDAESVLTRLIPLEREVISTDGRWFLVRIQPYRTVHDLIDGVVLTFVDITERKQKEERIQELALELEQQARVFNTTLTSISDFAYILDREGRFRYANKPLLDLLAIGAEEIVGKNFFDLGYPPDLAAQLQSQIQQVLDTKQVIRDETPFTGAAGVPGFYEYIFTPSFAEDGTVAFVAGSTRDVTERKKNELEVRQSRERLQKALEIETVGVLFFDTEGRFTDANAAFEQMSGFQREEIIRSGLSWADLTPPEWMAASQQAFKDLKATGRTTPYVKQFFRKDGSRFWGLFAASQINDNEVVEYVLDVSVRKEAEEAVRLSEVHFGAIVNQNLVGIFEVDFAGHIIFLNDEFARMLGYTREELLQMTVQEIVHPEDWVQSQKINRDENSFEALGKQKRFVSKNGVTLWVHNSVAPILNTEGQLQYVVFFSVDISQLRRAEEAVISSEARLRTLADAVPQLIWTNTPDGYADYFNQRWFDFSGLSYEECAGLGWQLIVHPDDAIGSVESWQRALSRGEVFDVEYRLHRADGVYRWHIGRNVPLLDHEGRVSSWFGTATDIEDLKQAEIDQRESEERYRLLVEGTHDYAMFLMDTERFITHWSVGAERVFDYTREEAIGMSADVIFTLEDIEAGVPQQETQTAAEQGNAADVRWHLRKDGSGFWADGVNTSLHFESGELRGFAKITRDATKERQAEAELRRAHDELELRVRERTSELQNEASHRKKWEAQRTQLMERMVQVQEKERERISRELHDNLGQHATAILLSLHMLQGSNSELPEGERRQTAPQLTRLRGQMDQLLDITHRLAWELRPAELDNVGLDAALRQYIEEWEKHGVATDFESRLPVLEGRKTETGITREAETALYRVVQEALTNVLRHAEASEVSVVLERGAEFVTAIIEDNGQGFDVEAASLSNRLGLRGMRERMELVCGTLQLESSTGGGTTVYARVPMSATMEENL